MPDTTFAGPKGFRLDPLAPGAHVRQIKVALNRLGFYRPDHETGFTEEEDAQYRDALYAFQRKATIFFDDTGIGPGSTTERILRQELERQNPQDWYAWRSVGDNSVRASHAARDGLRFQWMASPEGGNPGEDHNCRCWAEPIRPSYHPWIDWVREREATRRVRKEGVKADIYTDAIKPAIGPFDLLAAGAIARAGGGAALAAIRDILAARKIQESALPQRPKIDSNDRIFKKPDGIPEDWIASKTAKGDGMVYKSPKDPRGGTYVKVQKAKPESPKPGQRYDNVRWQKNGQSFDVSGSNVKRDSLESHIPIEKFKFNLEKFK